jgi:hypothetical protein
MTQFWMKSEFYMSHQDFILHSAFERFKARNDNSKALLPAEETNS